MLDRYRLRRFLRPWLPFVAFLAFSACSDGAGIDDEEHAGLQASPQAGAGSNAAGWARGGGSGFVGAPDPTGGSWSVAVGGGRAGGGTSAGSGGVMGGAAAGGASAQGVDDVPTQGDRCDFEYSSCVTLALSECSEATTPACDSWVEECLQQRQTCRFEEPPCDSQVSECFSYGRILPRRSSRELHLQRPLGFLPRLGRALRGAAAVIGLPLPPPPPCRSPYLGGAPGRPPVSGDRHAASRTGGRSDLRLLWNN